MAVDMIGEFLRDDLASTLSQAPLQLHVCVVRQKPETVDFSDPAIPPGFNAEKIYAGIEIAMTSMAERGWQADACMISPDETAGPVLTKQLGGFGRIEARPTADARRVRLSSLA